MDTHADATPSLAALEERIRELELMLSASRSSEEALAERVLSKLLSSREGGAIQLSAAAGQLVFADPPPGVSPQMPETAPRRWLVLEILDEIRLLPQMYFDPRYRLSRLAQFAGPVFVLGLLLSYFVVSVIPFVGGILERLVDMILMVIFYKVMVRELARYRTVLDYLARYGYR